jgi:hypothetical protein
VQGSNDGLRFAAAPAPIAAKRREQGTAQRRPDAALPIQHRGVFVSGTVGFIDLISPSAALTISVETCSPAPHTAKASTS